MAGADSVAPFRINGKTVDAMIDTGASTVAINETTARRLGFGGNDLNFKYKVNTANGDTLAAVVTLDRVEVGGVRAHAGSSPGAEGQGPVRHADRHDIPADNSAATKLKMAS